MRNGFGIILIVDDKVLLVRARSGSDQLNGSLAFPGGRADEGETGLEAALREFTEETGLTALAVIDFPGNYIVSKLKLKTGEEDVSFKVFIAKDFSGTLRPTDETEPFWMDLQEARKTKLLGKNNELLEKAIKFLKL